MARTISVEIVGDATSLERSFARASASARSFNRSISSSSTAGATGYARLSRSANVAERDIGKATRGALAGSGVFRGLGRSLAFASGGFLAFSSAFAVISKSVDAARQLAVTQRKDVAALKAVGKSWSDYRGQIEQTTLSLSHQSGFTNQQLLESFGLLVKTTGSATGALKLNAVAADVARGRNISLTQAAVTLGKAYDGNTTALKRLGIQAPKGAKGMEAIGAVAERFAGQAKAGASAADRFNATLVDSEEIIGSAILPVLNKLLARFGDWLDKMNRSGKLQKDVNQAVSEGGHVLHVLGDVIRQVDRVTGSFLKTLEVLAAFKFASMVTSWVGSLELLAAKWGLVGSAATAATGAETGALAAGGAGAAGAAGGSVVARVGAYTGSGAVAAAAKGAGFLSARAAFGAALFASQADQIQVKYERVVIGGNIYIKASTKTGAVGYTFVGVQPGTFLAAARVPGFLRFPGFPGHVLSKQSAAASGPFGSAQPQQIFTQAFGLNFAEQSAQAQAALTRGTRDDVAAAKQVVARVKRLIDQGRLKGQALIQALGLEASALSTIWSAEDAAAQKRAQAAAAAKARIEAQIDPLKLEVALSRAEAFGQPIVPRLKALLAAADRAYRRALAAHDLALEKEALDQIASLKQQIQQATTTATQTFTAPLKLQLALARDQALGLDQTKHLLKLKALILKFIRTHKHNLQALIDAYQQLAQVNQELGTSGSALGGFKQASTKKLTAGLGLTPAQRKALRARLSQLGPGGTVPGDGTGAFGYTIGPDGRVKGVHGAIAKADRPVTNATLGHLIRRLDRLAERPIHVTVDLDGRVIADSTTRHQQRRRRRNSSQRRGALAGGN